MSKKSKIEPSAKKKEENTMKAKVKFAGLKIWPSEKILQMCQVSYPWMQLHRVIGFTSISVGKDKVRDVYIIEGSKGNLELYDIG